MTITPPVQLSICRCWWEGGQGIVAIWLKLACALPGCTEKGLTPI